MVSLRNHIFRLRRITALSRFDDKTYMINSFAIQDLHPNIPKWFHQNVIFELVT
jgi:hypothetical protein